MARILVVEDDPLIQDVVKMFLMHSGFEVVTANDGVSALLLTHQAPPDLMLLDMGLPKLDGWQVARRLRASSTTRHIPIIALTAFAMEDDQRRAIGAGCDAFEAKPIDFEKLLATITTLLHDRL